MVATVADPLDRFADFAAAVRARLEQGRVTYGDRSFDRPEDELLSEIAEELQDTAAWSFILWTRLQRLKERMKQ